KKHPLGEKRNHPGSKLRQGFWMVFRFGVNNWGQILTDYLTLDGMELEVIKIAIDKAADNGKRSFSYINSILKNWRQNGIRTMVQVEDEQRLFQQKKQGQSDDDIQDPFIY
ncbi:DnaD domain protein, partial [Streptococcus pneumoniae]|nr:DnaD domain protein [Streptococcus pneumoniae]